MNIIDKNKYTFPFDTCEKPKNKFFAQPYSVTINFISTLIVLYFLFKTNTLHGFMLLFSLLLFDLSHTFSHFIHVKPGIQITLVHVLAYFLNFTFFYALYKYTKKLPSIPLIIFLVIVLLVDIYAFFNLSLLYYIFTQILFFFSIFIYYYSSLSNTMKKRLNILLIIIGIIYLGFVNEAFNCKKMLKKFPNFPFHALIEILILIAVYLFSLSFYNI
jgi:hypothetical protein